MEYAIELTWEASADGEGYYELRGASCTSVFGSASEWLEIAAYLRQRVVRPYVLHRRCAASYDGEAMFKLWCPRNAYGAEDYELLSVAEATALADQIVRMLRENGERCLFGEFDPILAGA